MFKLQPVPLAALSCVLGACATGPVAPMRELFEQPHFRVRVTDLERAPELDTLRLSVEALRPFRSGPNPQLRGVRALVWRDLDGDGFPGPAESRTRRTQNAAFPNLMLLMSMPLPAGRPLWIEVEVLLDNGWTTWVQPRLLAAELPGSDEPMEQQP